MENSSDVLLYPAQTPIPQVMVDLAAALVGTGPALVFGSLPAQQIPKQVALVVATSGSTGGSKEVGITSKALLASARASNKFLNAKFGQVWSLLLPLNHVAGINVLVRSLELGTTPIDLRGTNEFVKVDFTSIVPTQLFRALNGDERLLEHLKNCRAVLVGGAALPAGLSDQAKAQGINIVTTYGMTETCGGCVYDGTPLDGVEVKTENEIIKVKGSTLAYSYLNDEAAWKKCFIDGWFETSDRGEVVDGKLKVFGRADDVIISGGEKISLSAIEATLHSQFPETAIAAFAIPDSEWGNALHIAIGGEQEISTHEIASYLERTLGVVAKPKGFLILSELPMMGIGKVDRQALAQEAIKRKAR